MYKYIIILGLGLFLLGCKENVVSVPNQKSNDSHVYCDYDYYYSDQYVKTYRKLNRKRRGYRIKVRYCEGEQGKVIKKAKRGIRKWYQH